MSQLLDYTKKLRNFFGSELSEANNEPTFRIHKRNDKKSRKKIENLFLGQNYLKRIMN